MERTDDQPVLRQCSYEYWNFLLENCNFRQIQRTASLIERFERHIGRHNPVAFFPLYGRVQCPMERNRTSPFFPLALTIENLRKLFAELIVINHFSRPLYQFSVISVAYGNFPGSVKNGFLYFAGEFAG